MITDVQQYHIHNGDKESFYAFCRENGSHVYHRALDILHDEDAAKSVASEVLRQFRAEILTANGPFSDAEARLDTLTDTLTDALLSKSAATPVYAKKAEPAPQPFLNPSENAAPENSEPENDEPKNAAPENIEPENAAPEPLNNESSDEIRYDGTAYPPRKKSNAFITALIVLLVIVLLWLVLATLMRAGVLPVIDLGYTWFNANVLNLFHFLT